MPFQISISSAAFPGDRNQGVQLAYNSGRVDVNYHITQSAQSPRSRPCSTVPFRRDDDFVYRETLTEIHERCAQPAARLALVGLGGVGKSQLAIEYSYQVRHSSPETWVFWVHASSKFRIEEGYRRIAEAIKLSGCDDPKVDILQLVRVWLCDESNGRWVIIVDNADDLDLLSDLSGDVLPESSNGSVLVTSRSREAASELVGEDRNIIQVEPMSESYALALFRKRFNEECDDDDALALLRNLDCMPLAISQAAAYIRQRMPRITVSGYLKDFQRSEKERANLLNIAVRDRRRDGKASNSILATWQISFEYIQTNRPSAARLLSLMCLFDRHGIPEELITSRYEENDGTENFDEDIEVLRNYSLVALGIVNDAFEMHRLVQFATRKWLEQREELEYWKETYIAIMAEAFPSGEFATWERCRILYPHGVLLREYQVVDEDFSQQWAAVLTRVALYALRQGSYAEGEEMIRRVKDHREIVLGEEHPDTLASFSNLALSLQHQAKYEEAESINRRALKIREKMLGTYHPKTSMSLHNLARVLRSRGMYEESESMHRQALQIREMMLGKDHPKTLMSLHNLARVLKSQSKYEEAESMNRQALNGYEKSLGKEHPNTLMSLNNLACVLQSQSRYEEAESMIRQVLNSCEKLLGEKHRDTLTSIYNLAAVLRQQKKYEEAERMSKRALNGCEKILGKEHPDTLTSVLNLAYLLHDQQKYNMAKPLYERALAGFKKVLGSHHDKTKKCSKHYSSLLHEVTTMEATHLPRLPFDIGRLFSPRASEL